MQSGKEIIGEATEIYCDVVATSGGWCGCSSELTDWSQTCLGQ